MYSSTFLKTKTYSILPHIELRIAIIHHQLHKIVIKYKTFAMTVEILFVLHVANGIHITIQVYLHEFLYIY